ncbi:hypothetical protein D3H65_28435 [Paraflavitalea soli]|uniref:DUF3300 domain-containing protein n=1 Tax=Paraflavitalea soli TaxID=2315862 RepID=A0A3B7MWS7_9BACT|nr:hypothetical protein [Paraflavitalea soli]AXY77669.1 hypothetical protein D3H65_28435 [Paraflavitalea soli]
MKYLVLPLTAALCLLGFGAGAQQEQERLDLPGDNLNLYAVLKLFQASPTLEDFEKSLNDESNNINNLDLNGDNETDYIEVVDNVEGNVHNITLKVAVSKDEDQDVAVIVVEKDKDGQATIQVIGDEDLYGKDYIIEPNYDSDGNAVGGTPNPGYSGSQSTASARADNSNVTVQYTTTYEVATWPVVLFMFRPAYVVWRSPWYWGYHPPYWRPWRPIYWHQYYTYHYYWDYYYFGHYRRWPHYRVPGWRASYYGGNSFRRSAPLVQVRVQRGDYRNTYSRPDLAKQGSAMFKRDHPKAPSVHNRPPNFDKGGRPVRPVVTRPAVTRPTRPGGSTNPGTTRPVTRPTNPGTRPVTRPTNPSTRPVTKPVNPGTQPVTRPTNPSTRPVTRPTIRPSQPSTRPATRPSVQPATRPATRPSQPGTRPAVRPASGQ